MLIVVAAQGTGRGQEIEDPEAGRAGHAAVTHTDREPEQNGAKCFTRSVRETRMPKGCKLISKQPKYTGK